MRALPATLLAALVCVSAFSLGAAVPLNQKDEQKTPGATKNDKSASEEYESHSQQVSVAGGYVVQITQDQRDNQCSTVLNITGNGIKKTVDYPCNKAPTEIINFNKCLVIGDEWFSDQPKVLIHLTEGKCEKEDFTEQNGQISSTTSTLGPDECDKVKTKISELREEQKKWKEWMQQQEIQAEQGFTQLMQNLHSFQQQVLGGLGLKK